MLCGYAKLGRMNLASRLFEKMPERDVVSWNTMVMGYVRCGCGDEAVRLYRELRRSGIECNEFSFAGILTVCVKLKDFCLSKQIHGRVLASGYASNTVIISTVVNAYAKCGEMSDARRAFDGTQVKDILGWTTLVSGYAKWGDMEASMRIFDQMPEKNAISWTALIARYARNGLFDEVINQIRMMPFPPDERIWNALVCACKIYRNLALGKEAAEHLIELQPSSPEAYIFLSSVCASLGKWKLVAEVRKLMHDRCITNDEELHVYLYSCLS